MDLEEKIKIIEESVEIDKKDGLISDRKKDELEIKSIFIELIRDLYDKVKVLENKTR